MEAKEVRLSTQSQQSELVAQLFRCLHLIFANLIHDTLSKPLMSCLPLPFHMEGLGSVP